MRKVIIHSVKPERGRTVVAGKRREGVARRATPTADVCSRFDHSVRLSGDGEIGRIRVALEVVLLCRAVISGVCAEISRRRPLRDILRPLDRSVGPAVRREREAEIIGIEEDFILCDLGYLHLIFQSLVLQYRPAVREGNAVPDRLYFESVRSDPIRKRRGKRGAKSAAIIRNHIIRRILVETPSHPIAGHIELRDRESGDHARSLGHGITHVIDQIFFIKTAFRLDGDGHAFFLCYVSIIRNGDKTAFLLDRDRFRFGSPAHRQSRNNGIGEGYLHRSIVHRALRYLHTGSVGRIGGNDVRADLVREVKVKSGEHHSCLAVVSLQIERVFTLVRERKTAIVKEKIDLRKFRNRLIGIRIINDIRYVLRECFVARDQRDRKQCDHEQKSENKFCFSHIYPRA